jgi:hypothetical protein
MSLYQFGSGSLYGATLQAGVLVPRKFGTLQDVALDISFTVKELFGQYQFAVAIGRGQAKITGKAKAANIQTAMLNDLFFGQTVTTGATYFVSQESASIPATPFSITVSQSATWYEDLGVTYALTGLALTRVPSAPTTGQYTVAAGVYTFAAADTLLGVKIDYSYHPATTGFNIAIGNPLVGTTPSFVASFPIIAPSGKQMFWRLNYCVSSKLSMATKIEDWMIPEFDFTVAADASNQIGTFSATE